MSLRRIGILSLLLVMTGCAARSASLVSRHNDEAALLPIPADLQEDIGRAERIGLQLYLLDKAAWIATDVLREHVGKLEDAGIGGYLPLREGDDEGHDKDRFWSCSSAKTIQERSPTR